MQRWTLVLAAVLGLQVAAALALKLRPDTLTPLQPEQPLVATELKTADRLVLAGPAGADDRPSAAPPASLEMRKRDGHWLLPSLHDAPADPAKVQDLLARLAGLKRGLPVATTADALDRFKVGDAHYERRLVVRAGAKTLATVYLGSPAGPRTTSARTARDQAVYDVALSPYDLATSAADWFDHGLLQRDAGTIDAIEIARAGAAPITLRRQAGAASARAAVPGWTAQGLPADERLDPDKARALAALIAGLQVDSLADAAPAREGTAPLVKLTLDVAGGPAQTWSLWQTQPGGDVTLEASGRPWPLTLKSWTADPLLKALQPQSLAQVAGAAPVAAAASRSTNHAWATGRRPVR